MRVPCAEEAATGFRLRPTVVLLVFGRFFFFVKTAREREREREKTHQLAESSFTFSLGRSSSIDFHLASLSGPATRIYSFIPLLIR